MIQLKVLSGKMAGTELVARHFPFCVGRSSTCELSLDEPGVWDRHFQIQLDSSRDFVLVTEPQTSVTLAGTSVQQTPLRNGDVIEMGSAKILFGLSSTRQKGLTLREWLTWVGLVALCAGQILLIYRLPG